MKTGREKFGAFVHRDGRGCGPPSVTGAEGEEGEGKVGAGRRADDADEDEPGWPSSPVTCLTT